MFLKFVTPTRLNRSLISVKRFFHLQHVLDWFSDDTAQSIYFDRNDCNYIVRNCLSRNVMLYFVYALYLPLSHLEVRKLYIDIPISDIQLSELDQLFLTNGMASDRVEFIWIAFLCIYVSRRYKRHSWQNNIFLCATVALTLLKIWIGVGIFAIIGKRNKVELDHLPITLKKLTEWNPMTKKLSPFLE